MAEPKYKQYILDFRLSDGTTHSIPLKVPFGEPGKDGITPHIGSNGNWFIGEKDTGISAGGSGGYVVQDAPPEDTSVLWIDTDDNSDDGFQEAVNDALARAKASGEFDGRDYVLTDDDRNEIAELAAGLVEVPDAPSGGGSGGEWRQIADITLEEDTIRVDVSVDMDGKEIHLKEFYLFLHAAETETIPIFGHLNARINDKTIANNASGNGKYYTCHAQFAKGVGAWCWHKVAATPYAMDTNRQHWAFYNDLYKSNDINKISVFSDSGGGNSLGGAGTVIKIWGVDA